MNRELLSIVVPCFNEEEAIPIYYRETKKILDTMDIDYELLFIDDGSRDNSLLEMMSLAEKDNSVYYYSFSRNFGKEAAMYAGLKNAKGDYVTIMDVDLQDPPALLPEMLNKIRNEGYDSVATRRKDRKGESKIRSFFANMFYKIINKMSDADIVSGARDYRLMNRKMVDAVVSISESNRFSKGIFGWVGFNTYWLSYDNIERSAGKTKWSFWKLTRYAINGIIDFSNTPLDVASYFGIFMTFVAFVMLIFIVVRKLLFGDPVQGWTSTICVIIFIGGIQLFCIGIMGQYIGKTYMESKDRPIYIISKSNDDRKHI
ncbi:MAG: glycosyltransferase family 2 protein [Erysipelotrichaceae bacterium]